MKEVPTCKQCETAINPATAAKTNGLCIHCYRLAKQPSKGEVINLACMRCGCEYILGENAVVTTPEQALGLLGGYLRITNSPPNPIHQLSPDIISSEKKYSLMSREHVAQQKNNIKIIRQTMSSRQWRCLACNTVQRYPHT